MTLRDIISRIVPAVCNRGRKVGKLVMGPANTPKSTSHLGSKLHGSPQLRSASTGAQELRWRQRNGSGLWRIVIARFVAPIRSGADCEVFVTPWTHVDPSFEYLDAEITHLGDVKL